MYRKLIVLAIYCLSACTGQVPADKQTPAMLTGGFNPHLTAAELKSLCERTLADVKAGFKVIEADRSPATLVAVIGAMDKNATKLESVYHTFHMQAVHPDADIRDTATACTEDIEDFLSSVALSRPYFDRVRAIEPTKLTKAEHFMVEEIIRSYKLAGVDKDEDTRARIRSLRRNITEIGNVFDKNIREDVRYVDATLEELDGLPADYLATRPANENGLIRISTDYPDTYPVFTYAHNDSLRARLRIASRSRGYPQNKEVLERLITKRHELANILGFESFAALSMKSRMVDNPTAASNFLASISHALKAPVVREKRILLARLQQIDPQAKEVQAWQVAYLQNLLRQEAYALDSKMVRTYFTYDRVRDGIFRLTEDLFGVEIRPWQTDTWHESVETYEVVEAGQLIGRFYMDNHPRENKYKHAAHWTIRTGIKGSQIPLSALAQNFPKDLMEHAQVETFLHEFGHLIHNMFSGTQTWASIAGMSMERDFVEAPSQMLEEWIWDYDTIKTFAINATGEAIPKDLVAKMNKARHFGAAISTATQIYYARLSLDFYTKEPSSFGLDELMRELEISYSPYPPVEGTHFYANFGHLNGYSSNYYTYQWSLAIATDLFSRFKTEGMRNIDTAKDYRKRVLGAAGSKPAAEFVKDFLGRESTPDAYIKYLSSL